jgi:hypothetical protein
MAASPDGRGSIDEKWNAVKRRFVSRLMETSRALCVAQPQHRILALIHL